MSSSGIIKGDININKMINLIYDPLATSTADALSRKGVNLWVNLPSKLING
jgi:hypothetical protein